MSKDTGFSITSAERYSLALYELSNESNLLTQIEEQCSSVLELINTSDDFKNLIKDPTTKQDDLLKITNSISENYKFETLFKNFLNFLIQKRRFFFLERILKSFIETKIEGRVLGPVNAPIFRLKRKFRIRLLIRGIKSMKVQNSIAKIIPNYKFAAGIKLSVDVDPINFN